MYVLKPSEQEKLLQRLVLIENLEGGWGAVYNDPSTNTRWLLFPHHSEMQGGGLPILREDPPPSTLPDWLAVCFSSGNEDDIRGLGWELSRDFEEWPAILDWLEANSAMLSPDHVSLFVESLEILHPINRRSIVSKTITEVEEDYHFFEHLAQRAKCISKAA
jgi:hypothetical protein